MNVKEVQPFHPAVPRTFFVPHHRANPDFPHNPPNHPAAVAATSEFVRKGKFSPTFSKFPAGILPAAAKCINTKDGALVI